MGREVESIGVAACCGVAVCGVGVAAADSKSEIGLKDNVYSTLFSPDKYFYSQIFSLLPKNGNSQCFFLGTKKIFSQYFCLLPNNGSSQCFCLGAKKKFFPMFFPAAMRVQCFCLLPTKWAPTHHFPFFGIVEKSCIISQGSMGAKKKPWFFYLSKL